MRDLATEEENALADADGGEQQRFPVVRPEQQRPGRDRTEGHREQAVVQVVQPEPVVDALVMLLALGTCTRSLRANRPSLRDEG